MLLLFRLIHLTKIDIIYRLVIVDSCYTHVNNYFKGDIQLFSSIEGYFPLMNILYKVDLIYQNLFTGVITRRGEVLDYYTC